MKPGMLGGPSFQPLHIDLPRQFRSGISRDSGGLFRLPAANFR